MDAAQIANVSASGLVAVAAGVASVVYHWKARWWQSRWGRHVMAVTVSMGLLGLYTVLVTLVWPVGPVTAVLRVARTVLLVIVAGLLVQRTRLVIDAQRRVEPPAEK
jgi:uncharacterized membrane protein HdeD (DUF308 family)